MCDFVFVELELFCDSLLEHYTYQERKGNTSGRQMHSSKCSEWQQRYRIVFCRTHIRASVS